MVASHSFNPAMDGATEFPRAEHHYKVMFFDTDAGGVVSNISYLRFIETARTELAEAMGLDLVEMAKQGRYVVVARTEVDYRRPAVLGDHLLISGGVTQLERARFWVEFEITRPKSGGEPGERELLVTSRQSLAFVDAKANRPMRVPAEWLERWPGLSQVKSQATAS